MANMINPQDQPTTPSNQLRVPVFSRLVPVWLRGFWGITGLALVFYVLAFALWTFFHWGGEENAVWISDVAYLPVSLFAALCAWRITAGREHSGRLRWAWLALGTGFVAYFIADLIWLIYEVILHQSPFPSLADVFYLANYPLILLGLMLLPALALTRVGRVKYLLDMAIAIVAAWVPVWFLLIAPTMTGTEGSLGSQIIASAYPVGDLILITGLVSILLRQPHRSLWRAVALILGGVFFILAGDLIFSHQSLTGTYVSGSWVDITWIAGYLFWGWAALAIRHAEEDKQSEAGIPRLIKRASGLLPFLSSILGYGFLLLVTFLSFQQGQTGEGLIAGAALLTGLVLARQLVELRENQRLNAELLNASKEVQRMYQEAENKAGEREKEIKLAAKVGQRLSRLSDLGSLLADAVELIQERFELYHAQVYLVDPGRRNLVLYASTGAVGEELLRRGHQLPINLTSVNGTAAAEKRTVIIDDVSHSLIFRPNQLLPETRSEMGVPLITDNVVVGVLDVQSRRSGIFNAERLPAYEAIAERLAIAIENAHLLSEAERAREEIANQARRLTRLGWQEYLNAVERNENMVYTYAAEGKSISSGSTPVEGDGQELVATIAVAGEPVGKFIFEGESSWSEADQALVSVVARQVGQQVENLRLLVNAQHYREEAEEAVRRLTSQGWEAYFESTGRHVSGYFYDHNSVTPWETDETPVKDVVDMATSPGSANSTIRANLQAGEEVIGDMAVFGVENLGEESEELLATVAGQLSAHLENLRLLTSAQKELEERRKAEETLLKFRSGLEQTLDPVFMTDVDGTIIYVNPAFERVYGYRSEEAIGKTPRILKSGMIPQERYESFWQTLLNKEVVAGEIINKTKDGRLIPIEGTNTPILDDDETIVGFLAVHHDITERKQAQEKLSKRAVELETVAELSTAVTALSEPAQIMQTVVDMAKEAFSLYHAHIYELDETRGMLVLAAGVGEVGQQMVARGWEIPLSREHSLVARAARTRQSVIINDVRKEPDFMANPLLPETRAEMAVPILVADKVLGVLDIQSENVDRFSQEDANIQATLAAQVAVALVNARLYQKTQAALAEMKTMYAISSAATRSLELGEILQETLKQILAATGYEVGLVSVVDEATGKLQLAVHQNLPEPLVARLKGAGMDSTLCDLVYRQRQPVSVGDLNQGAPIDSSGLVRLGLRSYQGVPVEAKGRALGTICVFSYKSKNIQPSEMVLMQAAAQQIGIAIENVRLFRQIQRQAAYEAAVNSISQKIQSTTTVESAIQVAIRELGRALGAERTSIHLNVGKNERGSDAGHSDAGHSDAGKGSQDSGDGTDSGEDGAQEPSFIVYKDGNGSHPDRKIKGKTAPPSK